MIDVYGIGALNLDFIYEVAHLQDVDVPGLRLIHGSEVAGSDAQLPGFRRAVERVGVLRKVSPGGSASNTCHALSLMGYHVGLAGVLGADPAGDTYLEQVRRGRHGQRREKGEDGARLHRDQRGEGPVDRGLSGERGRLRRRGPGPGKARGGPMGAHDLACLRPWPGDTDEDKRRAPGQGLLQHRPGEIYAARGSEIFPLLKGTDVLFTSGREIEMLFGCDLDRAIGQALAFAETVVLKQGREGASLFRKGFSCRVGAGAVEAVDNTGAGDVLNGVFLGLVLRGIDPALALRVAVAAATSSVRAYGRDAYPDRQRIEVLYEDMLVHDGKR